MAIPSRQIGWGTKANLLWQISKQLEQLIGVTSKLITYYYYTTNACGNIGGVVVRSNIPLSIGDVVLTTNGDCTVVNGINPGPFYDVNYVSHQTCFVAPCQTTTTTTTVTPTTTTTTTAP